MKYCVKCGAELCDEAVVCPKCGCIVDGRLVEKDFPRKIAEKKAEPVVAADNQHTHTWVSMVLGILALVYSLSSLIFRVSLGELFNYLVCLSDSIIPIAIIVSICQLKAPKKAMPIIGLIFGAVAYIMRIIVFICLMVF